MFKDEGHQHNTEICTLTLNMADISKLLAKSRAKYAATCPENAIVF